MNRFKFLESDYPEIYKLCNEAEKNRNVNKARQVLEVIVRNFGATKRHLFDRIGEVSERANMPRDIIAALHQVRVIGNKGSHDAALPWNNITEDDIDKCINALFEVVVWLAVSHDKKVYKSNDFNDNDIAIVKKYQIGGGLKSKSETIKNLGIDVNPLDVEYDKLNFDNEIINVLDKDVFETSDEYAKRIENLPLHHIGYAILDKRVQDNYTGLTFAMFHIEHDEKIIFSDIDAFMAKMNGIDEEFIDGKIVVGLKVIDNKIYCDYDRVYLQSQNNNEIQMTSICWSKYKYEDDETFKKRLNSLPMLPLGIAKPVRKGYDLNSRRLPFKIALYRYVQSILNVDEVFANVDRHLAKQFCTFKEYFTLYGDMNKNFILKHESYDSDIKCNNIDYGEAIKYLESLAGFGIKPGLQRITKLLEILGDPQNKYKTIHVTGTNGKGSVCAMLSQISVTAKIKVGMFTSPHLTSYCERIKINNENIVEDDFAKLIAEIKICINKMINEGYEHPTLFEVLTAMAFKHFADQKVEYAVIEVGLGGLLDSTNVITPKVSIITNVANDHAERCDGNLAGIARHKAGIIKSNVPVVTAATDEALKIIRATARDKHSDIFALYEDFNIDDTIKLSLNGEYQKINAAIATKAAQIINDNRITNEIITKALQQTHWNGRFEFFNINGKQIIIDGAHNGAGAKALRMSLDKTFPNGRRIFLFGVLADKDVDIMIYNLFRKNDFVIVTKPQSERAADPQSICQLLKSNSVNAIAIENNDQAFKHFMENDNEIKIVAGSLYLIGHIREMLISLPK